MKKIVSLMLALLMCLSLCACSASETKFREAYVETYGMIEELNTNCEYVSSLMYDIWKAVGADDAYDAFVYMLNIPESFDTYWDDDAPYGGVSAYHYIEYKIGQAFGWVNNTSFGISFSEDAKEFHAMCMKFQESFSAISSLDETLAQKMKEIRATYYEDFASNYDLLNSYYLEVSSFAEFSQNPSGSLASFVQGISTYQNEIGKLAKAANIY